MTPAMTKKAMEGQYKVGDIRFDYSGKLANDPDYALCDGKVLRSNNEELYSKPGINRWAACELYNTKYNPSSNFYKIAALNGFLYYKTNGTTTGNIDKNDRIIQFNANTKTENIIWEGSSLRGCDAIVVGANVFLFYMDSSTSITLKIYREDGALVSSKSIAYSMYPSDIKFFNGEFWMFIGYTGNDSVLLHSGNEFDTFETIKIDSTTISYTENGFITPCSLTDDRRLFLVNGKVSLFVFSAPSSSASHSNLILISYNGYTDRFDVIDTIIYANHSVLHPSNIKFIYITSGENPVVYFWAKDYYYSQGSTDDYKYQWQMHYKVISASSGLVIWDWMDVVASYPSQKAYIVCYFSEYKDKTYAMFYYNNSDLNDYRATVLLEIDNSNPKKATNMFRTNFENFKQFELGRINTYNNFLVIPIAASIKIVNGGANDSSNNGRMFYESSIVIAPIINLESGDSYYSIFETTEQRKRYYLTRECKISVDPVDDTLYMVGNSSYETSYVKPTVFIFKPGSIKKPKISGGFIKISN